MSLSGYNQNPKTLSLVTSVNADNITTTNMAVSGTFSNPAFTTAQNNITTLQTNTQNQTAVNNVTTFSGKVVGGDASFNNLWGTVQTQAQPLITSVGTLTSLQLSGSVSGTDASFGSVWGTLQTPAQPNITSLGTLTGLTVSGTTSLQGTTARYADVSGNLSVTGKLSIAQLDITGNVKGTTTLQNCWTVGADASWQTVTFPNFTFGSDTQNGFTCGATSNNSIAYRGFGTIGGTYWSTATNTYNPDGSSMSTYTMYYNNGTASYGEFLSLACPNYYILTGCSFYNTDGGALNQTLKSVAVFGSFHKGDFFYIGSYTCAGNPPAKGTYSFSLSTTQPANYFIFQITAMSNWSGAGVILKGWVTDVVFTGYQVNYTQTKSTYIPQSVEIGQSMTTTLPTDLLTVNGSTSLNNDVTIGGTLTLQIPMTGFVSPYVIPLSGQIGYTWSYSFSGVTVVSNTLYLIGNIPITVGVWLVYCRVGVHNTPGNYCNITFCQHYIQNTVSGLVYDQFQDGATHPITNAQYYASSVTAVIQAFPGQTYNCYWKITHGGTTTNVVYGDATAINFLTATRIA